MSWNPFSACRCRLLFTLMRVSAAETHNIPGAPLGAPDAVS